MPIYSSQNFDPERSLGYLARRIHQIGSVALEPVFAAEGLTGPQWSTLVAILLKAGTTCAEIARDIGYDKGAMTRLVDTLESNGLVTRERGTEDRRVVRLALTDDGTAVALRCRARVIACWNEWLQDWDEGEVLAMIAMMQKLRNTLVARTADGAGA